VIRADFWKSNFAARLALCAIVLLSLSLRLFNLDWDDGHHLHPDERHLSNVSGAIEWPEHYFDSEHSSLNPYNHVPSFIYGTLPLFLNKTVSGWLVSDAWGASATRSVADGLGLDLKNADGSSSFDDGYNSNLVGRLLAALFDGGTLIWIYLLALLLFGRPVALMSALLFALTVGHIQHAHFFVNDPFLVFFTTAALYFCVRVAKYGRGGDYLLAGAALGFAAACKVTAAPLLAILLLGAFFNVMNARRPARLDGASRPLELRSFLMAFGWFLAATVVGASIFRVLNPYVFNGPGFWNLSLDPRFLRDVAEQTHLLQEGGDWPPNYQWVGRTPVLFPLKNLALWGLGLPLALAAAFGAGRTLWRNRRDHFHPELLLLGWIVLVIAMVSRNFVMTMRYLLPIYPVLVLLAAAALVELWRSTKQRSTSNLAIRAIVAVVIAGTALWAVGFVAGVYGQPHTRVRASEWIGENVPSGSMLVGEEWDDLLPLSLLDLDPARYPQEVLPVYQVDSKDKILALIDVLDDADYVILSSNRAYASLPRTPARYPSTTRYYDGLFSGDLGFREVAEFASNPGLLGVEIDDQAAEEAFTVYDHPKVMIFRKEAAYSRERAIALLQPDLADSAIQVGPATAARNATQLRPSVAAEQEAGGTWSEIFRSRSSGLSWLWFLLWVEAGALALLPWTTFVFARLPDKGFALSKTFALVVPAVLVWFVVWLDLATFSAGLCWGALLGMVALGAAGLWHHGTAFWATVREDRRRWLTTEFVFLGVFALFLLIRAANPDLWHPARGGEKPMELAFFTAVLKSAAIPPFDPWFAGGALNYYYFGWFMLAVPVRALGIEPQVAFNLGIPLIAGLVAASSFSITSNLVRISTAPRVARRAPALAGLASAFLLVLAGNLDTLRQMVSNISESVIKGVAGIPLDWWGSSRVFGGSAITEFPYWSFLFGDLHPHVMSLPLLTLLTAVVLTYVVTAEREDGLRLHSLALLLGALSAVIRATHTWDLPLALGIGAGAIILGRSRRTAIASSRWTRMLGDVALMAVAHLIVVAPFAQNYELFYSGFLRSPESTQPGDYLIHFGVFTFIGVSFLVTRWLAVRGTQRPGRLALAFSSPLVRVGLAVVAALGVVMLQAAEMLVLGVGMAVAALLLLTVLFETRRQDGDPAATVAAVFMTFAVGMSIVAELLVVTGDIGRMNSVFKFLYESWVLYALAGGYALWYVTTQLLLMVRAGRLPRSAIRMWVLGTIALLLASTLFPLFDTPVRLDDRFSTGPLTLDGDAYLGRNPEVTDSGGAVVRMSEDLPLIQWLRDNVQGSPTIVEMPGPLYSWTARISINTGLPTVIGWDYHETQQRFAYSQEIADRVNETEAFFTDRDPEPAHHFLLRYDVRYVVVGTLERIRGSGSGVQKLEEMPELHEVFRSGENVIYEVNHDEAMAAAYPSTASVSVSAPGSESRT
jgi:YYY domain-containing protein